MEDNITEHWNEAYEEGSEAAKSVYEFKEHVLAILAGADNRIQEILKTAQSGLHTGGTWSEADRIGVLTEALEDIVKICEGHLKKGQQ